MAVIQANELSREVLLTRDVHILFEEVRRVRKENEELKNLLTDISKIVQRRNSNVYR